MRGNVLMSGASSNLFCRSESSPGVFVAHRFRLYCDVVFFPKTAPPHPPWCEIDGVSQIPALRYAALAYLELRCFDLAYATFR